VSRPFIFLIAIIAAALLVPLILPWGYDVIDWNAVRAEPSLSHPLGTDSVGRDLLARTLIGTRVTVGVAVAAAMIGHWYDLGRGGGLGRWAHR
jgi:oligopeptide transport system permease protein